MTPIDENESWISSVPPAPTRHPSRGCRRAPARTGGHRRCTARRSGRRLAVARRRRTSARAAPGRATPAASRLARNTVVVVGGLRGEPVDLLRAPVVAGVGVDRDDLDARRGRRRQHDRRAATEAADLDDPTAGGQRRRGVVQRRRLAGRHPAVDVGDERHHVAGRPIACRGRDDRSRDIDAQPDRRRASTARGPAAHGRWRRPPRAPRRGPVRAPAGSAASAMSIGTIDSS